MFCVTESYGFPILDEGKYLAKKSDSDWLELY